MTHKFSEFEIIAFHNRNKLNLVANGRVESFTVEADELAHKCKHACMGFTITHRKQGLVTDLKCSKR